jgi:hypothetical protein
VGAERDRVDRGRVEMSDDYDTRLKQVQERNRFVIGHFVHTWRGRISDETLGRHLLNIEHFANRYLNYSAEADELRSLDRVGGWDVYDFITDWLPRKSWVDSARRIENYLASFNKLFRFMGEQGYISAATAADALRMLKEERQVMIDAAVTYYDEPEEEQSPEAFLAQADELLERWKAVHPRSENERDCE